MLAEAFLIKDTLFTFDLPKADPRNTRHIYNNYNIQNHQTITPVNNGKTSDLLLASTLQKIVFEEKQETFKTLRLALRSRSTPTAMGYVANLDYLEVEISSKIFRNLLLSLGDQMRVKLELRNPEVEVPSADPPSPVSTAIFNWDPQSGYSQFRGYTDTFPQRWAKYWQTPLNQKFSVRISIIICGNLILQKPYDLEGILTEKLHLDNEKDFIPKKMLEDKIATDISIMTPDGSKNECHKSFLIAQSAVFQTMLTGRRYKEGEFQEIEIVDMSDNGVKALLAYLYYRGLEEPSKDPKVALELIRAGNKYDISSLEKAMTAIILQKPIEWFDISTAIKMFFFSKKIDQLVAVKLKSLQVLKSKIVELTASNEYIQLFEDADDVKRIAARELSTALLNM